jgi:hypothetical protein
MENKYFKYKYKYLNLIGGEMDKPASLTPTDLKLFTGLTTAMQQEIFLKNCKEGENGGTLYDLLDEETQQNKEIILCLLKQNVRYICKKNIKRHFINLSLEDKIFIIDSIKNNNVFKVENMIKLLLDLKIPNDDIIGKQKMEDFYNSNFFDVLKKILL